MLQSKKKDNRKIALRSEDMDGDALKETSRKADQTATKKSQEMRVLVECNLIIEVSQSVAKKGQHANYIQQLIRGMMEQNKHIREVFDIDAFEPGAEGV